MRRYDLLLRKDASAWLLAVAADWRELGRLIARISNAQTKLRSNGADEQMPTILLHQHGSWHIRENRDAVVDVVVGELESGGHDRTQ